MTVHPNSLANLEKGKRFSKTYRPKNTGRRKDYLKEFIDESRISQADLKIILENLLMDYSFADLKKILAKGEKTLPAGLAAFIKGLITELNKGRVDVLNSMIDRIYGKATQTSVVEVYDIPDDAKKKMKSIFDNMLDTATEIKPANVLEQKELDPDDEEG